MQITVRYVLGRLKDDGWFLKRRKGSHHIFSHPVKRGTVTVAYNENRLNATIPKDTWMSIQTQAGWR